MDKSITKLPQWAQTMILSLQRDKATLEQTVNELRDTQTPSPVYSQEWDHVTRTWAKHYLQLSPYGSQVRVEWEGVYLNLILREGTREIDVCYGDSEHLSSGQGTINMIPSSNQQFKLRRVVEEAKVLRIARILAQQAINLPDHGEKVIELAGGKDASRSTEEHAKNLDSIYKTAHEFIEGAS